MQLGPLAGCRGEGVKQKDPHARTGYLWPVAGSPARRSYKPSFRAPFRILDIAPAITPLDFAPRFALFFADDFFADFFAFLAMLHLPKRVGYFWLHEFAGESTNEISFFHKGHCAHDRRIVSTDGAIRVTDEAIRGVRPWGRTGRGL
jgi:hypothetical protein